MLYNNISKFKSRNVYATGDFTIQRKKGNFKL